MPQIQAPSPLGSFLGALTNELQTPYYMSVGIAIF